MLAHFVQLLCTPFPCRGPAQAQAILSSVALIAENGQSLQEAKMPEEVRGCVLAGQVYYG